MVSLCVSEEISNTVLATILATSAATAATCVGGDDHVADTVTSASSAPAFVGAKCVKETQSCVSVDLITWPKTGSPAAWPNVSTFLTVWVLSKPLPLIVSVAWGKYVLRHACATRPAWARHRGHRWAASRNLSALDASWQRVHLAGLTQRARTMRAGMWRRPAEPALVERGAMSWARWLGVLRYRGRLQLRRGRGRIAAGVGGGARDCFTLAASDDGPVRSSGRGVHFVLGHGDEENQPRAKVVPAL